jgi:hypothetical protein
MKKVSLLLGAICVTTGAQALTITLVDEGGTAGTTAGGGTLTSLMTAAKQVWEAAYSDAHALTLRYSWASLTGTTLGVHTLLTEGGAPHREMSGRLEFDSSGPSWFADSTPFSSAGDYSTFTASSANLGGGMMNTGRVWTGATGDASGRFDLWSVVLHEVGHSLGLSSANDAFVLENGDGDIDITAPRSFVGASIPTTAGSAHLNIGTALMFPSISTNIRRCPSAADVVANAQISQFTMINYDPCGAVPEPATMVALGAGAIALIRRRRR